MDSTKYDDIEDAKGIVPIEDIIDSKYLSDAKAYAQYMKDITLHGNVTKDNRSPEDIEKDEKAIELLNKMAECNDPALAYGFMLYDETSIVKLYWTKRVGKLRKNKKEFFTLDKYLEWITEIFAVLNGDHPKIHDPLYYFKPGGTNKAGREVGDYDVMNSFKVHWNMYLPPILAQYLYAEDEKQANDEISIDAAMENENGAGNHLDAEMSRKNTISSPEHDADFDNVEKFLKAFLESPLSDPIPMNAGVKSYGLTFKDVMVALVDGRLNSAASIRTEFHVGNHISEKIIEKLKRTMSKYGVSLQDFAEYLSEFKTVALDILNGEDVSFRDYE